MKRLSIVALVVMLFAALFVPSTGAAPDPFVGAWTAIDPVDQSQMRLAIGFGKGSYRINLFDSMASACEGDQAVVRGVGTASGLDLSSPMDVWCLAPMRYVVVINMVFTYDPATDTLWDSVGQVTWQRMGGL